MSIRGKTVKSWHINNRSSWYSPVSEVRQDGSYIYEDFIPADGTDVKVYAVGPYYAHAEARKAPGLDGKVERDADGKEVRYPVILSHKEKMIARRVVLAFGQTVCGFDLLRANGKSYVCDVNGFSFVKTSTKYYEDTAKILGNTIMRRLATTMSMRIPYQMPIGDPPLLDLGLGDDPPLVSTPSGKLMELRCVLAVIRHGDRTPKQKMKVVVHDERFFTLFKKYDGFKKSEIKMKRPNQLMEVLELAREILGEQQTLRNRLLVDLEACEESGLDSSRTEHDLELVEEAVKKWDQMRTVLEMYAREGTRNSEILQKESEDDVSSDEEDLEMVISSLEDVFDSKGHVQEVGAVDIRLFIPMNAEDCSDTYGHFSGINRKVQLKYLKARELRNSDNEEATQQGPALMLILKWGGELTTADEGRVQMTAAAFAKGLLALEGELTPILMQMVKSANTDGLLDDDCHARDFQTELKGYLHQALQVPLHLVIWIFHRTLYLSETWDLAERRWGKELREFQRVNKSGDTEYDISKIPDIYDNIKYDMEHNPDLCVNNEGEFERMYLCVKNMADIVVPQEYGIRKDNKICVAQRVCTPLLKKIRNDLHRCIECSEEDESQTRLDPRASQGIATPLRHVRTRLYFTSESHIHTLMNLIRYGGLCTVDDKKWQRAMNFLSGVTEFNYMTQLQLQVVLMVYEDSRADILGKDRFHIELLFSPGLYPCFLTEKERIYENRFNIKYEEYPSKSNGMSKSHSREGNNNGASSPNVTEGSSTQEKLDDSPAIHISIPPVSDDVSVSSNTDEKAAKTSGLVSSSGKSGHHQHDSEDDLSDANSVNLVALDEVTSKQFTADEKVGKRHRHVTGEREKASEEGDRPREHPEEWRKNAAVGTTALKSPSQVSVDEDDCQGTVGSGRGKWAKDLLDETRKAMNSIKEDDEKRDIERKDSGSESMRIDPNSPDEKCMSIMLLCVYFYAMRLEKTVTTKQTRRSRFPYRFKHHTVNLLTEAAEIQNRLISTNVLMGKCGDLADKNRKQTQYVPGPAVMSTAVIARSSSAPRLQTYKAEDDISVGEIRRFWPPLRSLETLHDNVSFQQFDRFLAHLLTAKTPLPSPPKTPLPTASIEGEHSDLSSLSGLQREVEKLKKSSQR
uniref:Inositol hexakisphosphate and diphosphoinositol-pentakisphosphate kinase n=1 Tax=Heterorhabditis bacteriophora TaxID=37862 RepID=A0A1I7XMS6_HETBA